MLCDYCTDASKTRYGIKSVEDWHMGRRATERGAATTVATPLCLSVLPDQKLMLTRP